jgi:SAM-dependent methyltransferase
MNAAEIMQLDRLESKHWWYRNRKVALRSWATKLPNNAHVLDAGSGSGANTLALISNGFRVESLELSEFGCELQRKKGILVTRGDLRKIPWDSGTFDAVVCMDVLEHIEDHRRALDEIVRVLKPAGTFLITVPEDTKLWSEHDVAVNHYRRYSKLEIINLVESSGLIIDRIWSSNVLLKPLIKALRRRSKGSDLKEVQNVLNWTMLVWANLERLTFLKRFSGVTIWITGRNVPVSFKNRNDLGYE